MWCKGKGSSPLQHAVRAQPASRGIVLLILNIDVRWCGRLAPRPGWFTPGAGPRYPLYRRLGRPQGQSGRFHRREEYFPHPRALSPVANPDPEVRSSGGMHIAALYRTARLTSGSGLATVRTPTRPACSKSLYAVRGVSTNEMFVQWIFWSEFFWSEFQCVVVTRTSGPLFGRIWACAYTYTHEHKCCPVKCEWWRHLTL
jgi:hypothetical protein